MKLTVHRKWFTENSTIGSLDIDGVFECYTLEPVTREDDHKPRAIPPGSYTLRLLPSAKFEIYTPHVLNVPGFTAIEIHWGNGPEDTEGCLLLGQTRGLDWIGNSSEAFRNLVSKLDASADMSIEYREERSVSA